MVMINNNNIIRIKTPFIFNVIFIFICIFLFFQNTAFAELQDKNILNNVLAQYKTATSSWVGVIQNYAEYFFGGLAVMGFVWQISQAYFHRPEFTGVLGEIIRYMVFCGVFLWFLRNGPELAQNIIDSMRIIGAEAAGVNKDLKPSYIVDIGFTIFDRARAALYDDPLSTNNIMAFILALIVLVILSLIGINMLLQLCTAWVPAYAGVIFLGFGGSYWTKDMSINYFKTVLGTGVSLMTMTLLIGIGSDIINRSFSSLSERPLVAAELTVLLITAITLFMLVDKLPALVAGIINGASIGSSGIGAFGASAAVGAALTAKGIAGNRIRDVADLAKGTVAGLGKVATGGAGLVSAYKASKEGLIGKNTDEFNKAYESGGISSKSLGFVKPPLSDMAKGSGQMVASSLGSAFSNAKENSFGGKLAKTISGQEKK